jgi:DNA-binding response OmpR family regulator
MTKLIVAVDDDDNIRKMLSISFQSQGFSVKSFENGKDALDFLLDEKNIENLSLLILDRMLPDMDGLEILKKVQEKYENKIPVLILSVVSSQKDILEGLKQGALEYINKPFNLEILMQKAKDLIEKENK